MYTSKVTQKFQATIPSNIRDFLNIKEGDRVAFEIDKNQVIIKKLKPIDIEYLHSLDSTLSEWSSPEDDEAYRDL